MLKIITEKEKVAAEVESIVEKQTFRLDSPAEKTVRGIIEDVACRKDAAVVEYTRKFDQSDFTAADLPVSRQEIEEAYEKVDCKFKDTLAKAIQNISAYHKKQKPDEWFETLPHDVILGQRLIPLSKVGIYIPGGCAAYPSSVVMCAVPAKAAKVKEIIITSPPPISPYVLVAAEEVGVSKIFKAGGAQAIAAMAYGTETIPRVDKIVGPGNVYVTLAKKLVYGTVGIDGLAGPSNVVIIADDDAEPEFLAADLLSQVEHDPSAFSILLADSERLMAETEKEIHKQVRLLKRGEIIDKAAIYLFLVESRRSAVDIVNRIAPEHLELQISSPQKVLEHIKNAGAIFLGPHSPVPIGDYIAGPNHVLPTGGTARYASPLGVYDFVKTQSIVGYTKPALKNIWKDIVLLAEIEGLDAHARAIDARFM